MSLTGEIQRAGEHASGDLPPGEACAHCGSPLREDQEWCLECGAARTLIHRTPDWRIAALVIGSVVVLAVIAFAIALVNLSSNADRVASAPPGRPSAATTTARTATARASGASGASRASGASGAPGAPGAPGDGSAKIASWPVGLSGWTVALSSSRSQTTSNAEAARLAAAGLNVGVLDSSRHPSMKPGEWIVFSGRYPGRAAAAAAATALVAKVPSATPVVRQVAPPGGL